MADDRSRSSCPSGVTRTCCYATVDSVRAQTDRRLDAGRRRRLLPGPVGARALRRRDRPADPLPAQRDQPRHHRQLRPLPRPGLRRADDVPRLRRPAPPRLRRHRARGPRGVPRRRDHPGRRPGRSTSTAGRRRPAGRQGEAGDHARGRTAGPSSAARTWPSACCAATGSTGPRWCSAPSACSPTRSATACRSSRTSPWSSTWWRPGRRWCSTPTVCFSYRRHTESASSASLLHGRRLPDERRYYAEAAAQMQAHGWRRAARTARLRWTSRLHALTLLPEALRARLGPRAGCSPTPSAPLDGVSADRPAPAGTPRASPRRPAATRTTPPVPARPR